MKSNQNSQSLAKRLTVFFGLAYFCQMIAQATGVISQPLDFYFKQALGLNPAQATEYLAILTLPWVIKPLYGLLSDFIPIFGYRRKSYFLILSAMAAAAFAWLSGLTAPAQMVTALLVSAFGVAFCDVITDAVMVENGQTLDKELTDQGKEPVWVKKFQSTQWLCASIASLVAAFIGSRLCVWFPAHQAVHIAALVVMIAPISVMVVAWFFIKEQKAKINLPELKTTARGYTSVFKSKAIWIVVAFLFFWNFSPSFGMPFYYHMVDNLKFSQDFIGNMGMVGSIGSIVGAAFFGKLLTGRMNTKQLIILSIVLGTAGTLGYLLLTGHMSALILSFLFGIAGMIANLTILGLAGEHCPKHAEGFTFAALMSVINFSTQLSAIIGSRLYVNVFHNHLTPLIWVSAAFTAAAIVLVPFLPKPVEYSDEPKDGSKPDSKDSSK